MEPDPALAPFFAFGAYVFGHENNLGGLTDELAFFRAGLRSDQRKTCRPIRRANGQPAIARREAVIKSQMKSKLIQVEPQASILIANINRYRVETEIGILAAR